MVFLTLLRTYGRRIRFKAKGKTNHVGHALQLRVPVISFRSVWPRLQLRASMDSFACILSYILL